jgi:hypothetical protein
MIDTDWMAKAACRNWLARWTDDHTPPPSRMRPLTAVCLECPVRSQCASYALDIKAERGMYAGVWIPMHGVGKPTKRWLQARARLQRRLGRAA